MEDATYALTHGALGHWLWLPLALLSSLLSAQNVEANRRSGQEGFRLNLWRMGYAALFWSPLALLQNWPTDPAFYAVAIFAGFGLMIGFTIQNDLAMKHNGRVAILHMPLKAVAVFLLWAVIDPVARHHVISQPLTTLGVMACLGIMVGAMAEFRKNDVSWSSLRAVMPIVVLYGAADLLTRLVIQPHDLQERLIVFLWLMTSSSALVSLIFWRWRPHAHLPIYTPRLARAGAMAALGGTANQVCFFGALVLGPSPAYVSMVALLAPVWLLFYHRLRGVRDDASPIAGTIMVFAAIILMVLVA